MSTTPINPVNAVETFSSAGTSTSLGALSSTFHPEGPDNQNVVTNKPFINPSSNLCEDRCFPAKWMCATSNTAQSLNTDRFSNKPHTPMVYDPQNIIPNVSYMSRGVNSPGLQLYPGSIHPLTSPLLLQRFFELASNSPDQIQEATSVELSEAVQSPIEVPQVSSPVPQSQQDNPPPDMAVALRRVYCPICYTSFTRSSVRNRHVKDIHEDKASCHYCPSFKWSRGRPHLYEDHLQLRHPEFASSEDRLRPGGKRRVSRARRRKVLNKSL